MCVMHLVKLVATERVEVTFRPAVARIIPAEHLRRHIDYEAPGRRRRKHARGFRIVNGKKGFAGSELLEGGVEQTFHAAGVRGIGEREQLPLGREDIDALRIAVEAAAGLLENLSEQFPFGILQMPVNVLVDGDGYAAAADEIDHLGILEDRRTVGDAVVSDAPERVAGPRQHVDGFLLLGRLGARLQ
jgi:hypothetical protein